MRSSTAGQFAVPSHNIKFAAMADDSRVLHLEFGTVSRSLFDKPALKTFLLTSRLQ
jgi:acyl dehydratase